MENDLEVNSQNGEDIIKLLEGIEYHLRDYVNSKYENEMDSEGGINIRNQPGVIFLSNFINYLIPEYKKFLNNNFQVFENNDFVQIIWSRLNSLGNSIANEDETKLSRVVDSVGVFIDKFENIKLSIISLQNANALIRKELQPAIDEVKEKVKDFEAVRLALEQRETSSIYLELHDKYDEEYEENNHSFYITFGMTIFFTIISILYTVFSELNWVVFISVKVLILAVGITLCTLFLRRAAHAKKLKEQAYQTHVEINAFPIHVRSLREEDKQELIKELALKYFGKELDHTQNDKIGDLMQDQLLAGTELIKASAELVKAKQGSGGEG